MKKLIFAVIVALTSIPASAQASYPPLEIVVEDPSEGGARCGVSKGAVESSLRGVMRYNRVAEAPANSSGWYVHISPNVLKAGPVCAAHMTISITRLEYVEFGGKTLVGKHEACTSGLMFTSGTSLATDVAGAVKQIFEACLSDIDRMASL